MAEKTQVKVIVGSGFAYKVSDPGQIFLDIKTADYPWRIFASRMMFIGGQWIKEAAIHDNNPFATFVREVTEELSFERPRISTEEMRVVCPLVDYDSYVAPGGDVPATLNDEQGLAQVKARLIDPLRVRAFGDYYIRTPERLIQTLQPEYLGGDLTALFSIFTVGLEDDEWDRLAHLQAKFGNLSNESQSVIISIDQVLAGSIAFASGYDQIARDFWISQGFPAAAGIPIQEIEVVRIGDLLASYVDYLARYDVLNRPPVKSAHTG